MSVPSLEFYWMAKEENSRGLTGQDLKDIGVRLSRVILRDIRFAISGVKIRLQSAAVSHLSDILLLCSASSRLHEQIR